ncbi:hypothetical protein KU73_00830 [Pectobacterium wasabiae]|uniref:Secreted peptide n=1 Tax=Pectobacterium wasabiae TaxID=55208 RepID=A0AAW3ELB2_9GAMM|nr:hypothetical protein A7983_20650 [Pectobacterium wasabiae CFBP 3304]KFX05634.1 hypothetical protein JV38_13205 [Pectobacterium wasabiae]KGA30488.1 hypothetical protein KU73_00830 [Pectobacterium wasabiae]
MLRQTAFGPFFSILVFSILCPLPLLFSIPSAFLFSIANGYRCVHINLLQKRYFLFVLSLNKTARSGWLFINRPMQNNE